MFLISQKHLSNSEGYPPPNLEMAKRVNSFTELFQAGPSENQIFKGLDEIVPPSVLENFDASTPIMPHAPVQVVEPPAQPEAGPQAPLYTVDPPAEPEAGLSQTRGPRTRFTDAQVETLKAFINVYTHPGRTNFSSMLSTTASVPNWRFCSALRCATIKI